MAPIFKLTGRYRLLLVWLKRKTEFSVPQNRVKKTTGVTLHPIVTLSLSIPRKKSLDSIPAG